MKLSEAMRLGSMLKPQGFGDLHFLGKTCALGAADEAVGCDWRDPMSYNRRAVWPWLYESGAMDLQCPACQIRRRSDVLGTTTHLNDEHLWTRERIADWIATIEPQESTPGAEVVTDDQRAAARG